MQVSSKAKFEVVPQSDSYSFAIREFNLPRFASPWHFHPECELTYIVQSRGKWFAGDHRSSFGPGDLVLLGSKLPHAWSSDPPAEDPGSAAHAFVIHFKEDFLGADFLSRPEMARVRSLLNKARRGLLFTGKTSEAVAERMARMIEANALEKLIDVLSIFQILVEAKQSRVLSSAGFSPFVDELAGERMNRAYRYIFDHFSITLDYAELAHSAGMSLSGFCHYFKRATGRTVSDFLSEVRVGHASRLLIETDLSIAEIAYASGYGSLSNFNRRFHGLTGLTPGEYRHQHPFTSGAPPGKRTT